MTRVDNFRLVKMFDASGIISHKMSIFVFSAESQKM
jgi:hypothetical protein